MTTHEGGDIEYGLPYVDPAELDKQRQAPGGAVPAAWSPSDLPAELTPTELDLQARVAQLEIDNGNLQQQLADKTAEADRLTARVRDLALDRAVLARRLGEVAASEERDKTVIGLARTAVKTLLVLPPEDNFTITRQIIENGPRTRNWVSPEGQLRRAVGITNPEDRAWLQAVEVLEKTGVIEIGRRLQGGKWRSQYLTLQLPALRGEQVPAFVDDEITATAARLLAEQAATSSDPDQPPASATSVELATVSSAEAPATELEAEQRNFSPETKYVLSDQELAKLVKDKPLLAFALALTHAGLREADSGPRKFDSLPDLLREIIKLSGWPGQEVVECFKQARESNLATYTTSFGHSFALNPDGHTYLDRGIGNRWPDKEQNAPQRPRPGISN